RLLPALTNVQINTHVVRLPSFPHSQKWLCNEQRPTANDKVFYELHKERDIVLPPFVGTRFQVLLTPLAGVLFTFPSRYWFTIGQKLVFSLTEWSPQIPAGFLVPRGTQVSASSPVRFRLRGYHTLWPLFPEGFD